jgi:hypothetical protein
MTELGEIGGRERERRLLQSWSKAGKERRKATRSKGDDLERETFIAKFGEGRQR